MEHTKIVTAGELEDYADRADSERVIPELPVTSVKNYTEHMGNTFAPKGFSALVIRHVS